MYFSASSSGSLLAVGVSREAELGIDLAMVGDSALPDAVDVVATQRECAALKAWDCDSGERMAWLWTRKEAVAKAAGLGLVEDLRSVEILDDVVSFAGCRWWLSSWLLDGTTSFSVAVEHGFTDAPSFVGFVTYGGEPVQALPSRHG